MDGVIVNLRQRVLEQFGQDGIDILNSVPNDCSVWDHVDSNFWGELNWMEDGQSILKVVEAYFDRESIMFCTKPTTHGNSCSGKLQWIQQNLFDYYHDSYIFTRKKEQVAAPDILLIDDSQETIDAFIKAGGQGILIPREWNKGEPCKDVPAYLEKAIQLILSPPAVEKLDA